MKQKQQQKHNEAFHLFNPILQLQIPTFQQKTQHFNKQLHNHSKTVCCTKIFLNGLPNFSTSNKTII